MAGCDGVQCPRREIAGRCVAWCRWGCCGVYSLGRSVGVEEGCGFLAGAVEEEADAEGLEAGGGGDFGVAHTFDVGKPEEFALAGLEGLEGGADVDGGVEVGGMGGVGELIGLGGGLVIFATPAVADEVGGDAEEIAASLVGIHDGTRLGEETDVGFLEQVFGEVVMAGDGDEVGENGAGGGVVEALECGLGHGSAGLRGGRRREGLGAGEDAACRIIREGHGGEARASERARG